MATIEEQQKHIAAFRDAFRSRPSLPLGIFQTAFLDSPPAKGPYWITRDIIRVNGENSVRDSIFEVTDFAALEPVILPSRIETPAVDVYVEWIGQRRNAARDAETPPGLTGVDIYKNLRSDTEQDLTILFTHGGAFYSGSSATSRATTTKLARLAKACVLSVDYRLAPKSQFPAQLLDLLLVYLALLYPPAGSLHEPVHQSKIVLAGESSGGGLALSLVQYILHLQRMQDSATPTVRFGGRDVTVPMPAGITVLSAEADKSLGLVSWKENGDIDFLQEIQPANAASQPSDSIWPSKPPRHDVYCHASAYVHPISNPSVARNWHGSPPLWFAYGQERCLDGGKLIASTAAAQGVTVQFVEYDGMPHIFAIVFPRFIQSQACMAGWATICGKMAAGEDCSCRASRVSSISTPGDSIVDVDVTTLLGYSRSQAMAMMRAAAKARKPYEGRIRNTL